MKNKYVKELKRQATKIKEYKPYPGTSIYIDPVSHALIRKTHTLNITSYWIELKKIILLVAKSNLEIEKEEINTIEDVVGFGFVFNEPDFSSVLWKIKILINE